MLDFLLNVFLDIFDVIKTWMKISSPLCYDNQ